MKNFLITGGAGFVGSHITEKLIAKGHSVTIIDDLNTGKKDNLEKVIDQIEFVKGDIRDIELLRKYFKNKDGIFHQAARASVPESFEKPDEYYDVNVNGTRNVFQVAKEYGIKVVYASSSSVYGDPEKLPIAENAVYNPINPYAENKVDKEKLAKKFAQEGLKIIGMRYFNIFGDRQSKEYAGVIKKFLERIQEKLPPKINGDGKQSRDFVFIKDVVNANVLSMESDIDHIFFNVGTGTTISILEIANLMINISKLDKKPIHGPPLRGDVIETLADISLIQNKLNWKPTVFLEDWLKEKLKN